MTLSGTLKHLSCKTGKVLSVIFVPQQDSIQCSITTKPGECEQNFTGSNSSSFVYIQSDHKIIYLVKKVIARKRSSQDQEKKQTKQESNRFLFLSIFYQNIIYCKI